jgi:hypothetical protein
MCGLCSFPNTFQMRFYYLLSKAQDAVSIVLNMQKKFLSPTRGNPSAHYARSLPTLVNLTEAPLGPPWQIPCRAANMEIVIVYYWLLIAHKACSTTSVDIL